MILYAYHTYRSPEYREFDFIPRVLHLSQSTRYASNATKKSIISCHIILSYAPRVEKTGTRAIAALFMQPYAMRFCIKQWHRGLSRIARLWIIHPVRCTLSRGSFVASLYISRLISRDRCTILHRRSVGRTRIGRDFFSSGRTHLYTSLVKISRELFDLFSLTIFSYSHIFVYSRASKILKFI